MIDYVTPYKLKPTTFVRLGFYEITFEDEVLMGIRGKENAESMVAALNGAYNLGRANLFVQLPDEVIEKWLNLKQKSTD